MDADRKAAEAIYKQITEPFKTTICQIPSDFFNQKDGAEKIRYCLNTKKMLNDLPSASEVFKPKNDALSTEARTKGNEFFRVNDYVSAMYWYNRSICFAPKDSENLGMGYANRSAIFLKSGFNNFCLQNIDLAMTNNYPEKLKEKLENRKKECLEMMKTREDSLVKFDKEYTPLQLSYPANKRVPMMIEGLEFAKSEQYGRFIRTTRDLKPGDVLIIEKSFTKTVQDDFEYKSCTNCLRQNYMNLFPCDHCTRVMFCSDNCQVEANKRFHKYECKVIDGLNPFTTEFVPNPKFTAIRAALQSITMFDDPQELQKLISDIDAENKIFEIDYANLTEKDYFCAAYSLNRKESDEGRGRLYLNAANCASFWHLFSQYTDLRHLLKTKDMEDLFLNLLYNFFRNHIFVFAYTHGQVEKYGSGVFALCSLLNHSCIPNVQRICDKDTIFIVAQNSIKAGEQLFSCYGFHLNHRYVNLEKRKETLLLQYGFECKCIACCKDYPLLVDLSPHSNPLPEYELHATLKEVFDKDFAVKTLKEYVKKTIKFEKGMPSHNLIFAECIIASVLNNLMFGRPLNMQLKPI